MKKSTGSYYTPENLASFVCKHSFEKLNGHKMIRILEPSCGDGVFLKMISEHMKHIGIPSVIVDAVEIDSESISIALGNADPNYKNLELNFINKNFLEFKADCDYDFVIGNPPYIGKTLLNKENLEYCRQIHLEGGLGDKHIRNIWTAFLIKATFMLKPDGVLALILPGELLQVSFAKNIQCFLEKHYNNIEILTFEELVFPGIGQDVVVLFAHKKSSVSKINFARVRNLESLELPVNFAPKNLKLKRTVMKWSNFFLDNNDLDFLLQTSEKMKRISDFCTSSPGIVTGANNFFIVNNTIRKKYKLESYCKPVIQKGLFVSKSVCFDKQSFEKLKNSDFPCYFIDLKDTDENRLPPLIRKYLKKGKDLDIHNRYKCSRRKPWYNVPSVWEPEGFFFKRCHLFPKFLKNDGKTIVTDSAYHIRVNNGFDIGSVIFSFYNSLTLIFCELMGRFYGGGVLELTPLEFRGLPIPYKAISTKRFREFCLEFENSEQLDQILLKNNRETLNYYTIDNDDIHRLEDIRQALVSRRLKENFSADSFQCGFTACANSPSPVRTGSGLA